HSPDRVGREVCALCARPGRRDHTRTGWGERPKNSSNQPLKSAQRFGTSIFPKRSQPNVRFSPLALPGLVLYCALLPAGGQTSEQKSPDPSQPPSTQSTPPT